MKYAFTPSIERDERPNTKIMIPEKGRCFESTISVMRMNICANVPGMKNPVKKRRNLLLEQLNEDYI